jgi:TRAP-type C4-dicarboxylate transport system permease large subunit
VLIILGVALGFTNYLVDAEIPLMLSEWIASNVSNKYIFLLALNILLLLVGCLMDIYSAIIVVVPLIVPIAAVFGINPVHLGILFLANLELGYLTPPVGLNLFLASFRFKIPLPQVYRLTMPFLAIMIVGVLLITYVPSMTTWGLDQSNVEEPASLFEEMDMQDLLEEGTNEPELDMDAIMRELEAG